jgi:O-antigen/teichoic acid export membrane protein
VLATPILELIYGSGFYEGAPALRFLAATLLVLYVYSAIGGILICLNLERRLSLVSGVTVVLNIGLNFLLIPHWQHVGAAVATLVSELAVSVGFFMLIPKQLLSRVTVGVGLRAALAAAGMALVVSAASAASVPVLVLVPLGAAVYGGLALALRVIPNEDFAMLWQAIRRPAVRPSPESVGSS